MSNNNSNRPSHFVHSVRSDSNNKKDYWTKIGVAFAHNDGKGFSIQLEAMPLDGKLTIREADFKNKK